MATELFKVSCVTCQASLSVRNPALVGQIVACPKCDSMVLIEPPSSVTPSAPVVAASETLRPASPSPKFEEPIEDFSESESITEPSAPLQPEPAEFVSVLEAGTSSSVNFILWSVASFVVGATLMGALLVWRSGDESIVATTEVEPTSVVEQAQETAEIPRIEPNNQHAEIPPLDEARVPKPSNVAEARVELTPEADQPLSGPIVLPPQENVTGAPPVTPTDEKPEPKLVINEADEPRVARKYDPLQLDPEQIDLSSMSAGAAAESAPIDDNPDPQIVEQVAEVDAPAVNQSPVQLIEKRPSTGRHSAEIQLKRKLPELEIKDMPILNFLSLVSQLSGVPVSIAPEQLQMAGISAGRPLSVQASAKSVGEILDEVLDPLHLEVRSEGEQVLIVRQHGSQIRSIDYPVDDLGVSHTELAQWVEELVAPETWKSVGGPGTITVDGDKLRIEQTQAVQYEVLIFLERIRLAKQKPLRSKYPERLLSSRSYIDAVAGQLAAPAIFTFSHETTLAEVFQYWQGEMGMPVFVDWAALATVKLWPESSITCRIANEPWHAALDKVLEPLGLSWRAVAGGGIQITSREIIESQPVLDIYPGNEWQLSPEDATVIHDRVNNLTYVRAPALLHRQ